jgi:uncharacterized protein (DUF1015 family)
VPRFEPFRGLRYDTDRVALRDVTAPPYDVIDDEERARLVALSPHNAVRVELPLDEAGDDRYTVAARLLDSWQADGILIQDVSPGFYLYRMDYDDDEGGRRHTAGFIGALELSSPGEADVLPHEETTPKARSDRLELLRATRTNTSPVWGLSLAAGLSDLCERPEPPLAQWTDGDRVEHRLWRVADPDDVAAITGTVAAEPVVIADGHHRYDTGLAYRDERRAEGGEGDYDLAMAFVVALAEDQLTVRPIHRLLSGLPDGFDLPDALTPFFELEPAGPPSEDLPARMREEGALALVVPGAASLLRPRSDAMAGARDLDTSRLDVARASLPPHEVVFQHGTDNVLRAVEKGDAQAGVLLRPITVATIADAAHRRERMPPKTTFFHPKPKTGLVFRQVG